MSPFRILFIAPNIASAPVRFGQWNLAFFKIYWLFKATIISTFVKAAYPGAPRPAPLSP